MTTINANEFLESLRVAIATACRRGPGPGKLAMEYAERASDFWLAGNDQAAEIYRAQAVAIGLGKGTGT